MIKYNDECWLYIIANTSKNYQMGITGNLKQRMNTIKFNDNLKLIYYKKFHDILEAAGYKLLLQKLSSESVDHIIKKVNPEKINLFNNL